MQAFRRILSVALILAFALGMTAQAAQMMPMNGMVGDAAVMDMSMGGASSLVCPDCDDMDQGTMDRAACQSSICIAPPMLPPEMSSPVLMPAGSAVLYNPALGWGMTPHPEPYPPRSVLRI